MKRLTAAAGILGFVLLGIIVGISLNQAWLSGALCIFGWTPAVAFFGFALAGVNLSVSVKAKESSAAPKANESSREIKQRVSKAEQ